MLKKLVLTGGPCSGKTTAHNYLAEKLSDCGFSVIFVPEVPSLIINSGLDPRKPDKDGRFNYFAFEKLLFETQLLFENKIFSKAMQIKGGSQQVIIFDRGCMDYCAYMSEEEFQKVLQVHNLKIVDVRDARYDAVFHLVTAAEGKEEFYNMDNAARLETAGEARKADLRTRNAWLGHPHLKVIDNSTLFEEKMKRLLNAVRKTLGIPIAIETEKKFLVRQKINLDVIPIPFQEIEIEQAYLPKQGEETIRIRRRSQENQGSIYYKTRKSPPISAMSRIETEREITKKEYYQDLINKSPDSDLLRKTRICFLYKHQYFELDIFSEPKRLKDLILLEIELTEENERVEIPDWLGNVTEVTTSHLYTNYNLAQQLK